MSELSEKELLLLTNYEYFYCSTYSGTIQENIDKLKLPDGSFDMELVVAQGATGDIISDEDAIDILKRLEDDEELSKLHAARVINEGGIRATLFANDDESEATLVFRGTGGTYKAWKDNVLGEYQTDTGLQKIASDFVKYECGQFNNITVTGHSKGGNLSQYVTIVCGAQIDRCISFDGQGFGQNFLEEHAEQIEEARGKITSISAFNDFVNILLTPVAGTVLYVKNQEDLSVDMHSCYTMLSNGSFDDKGNFKRDFGVIPQLPAMTLAKWASDGIVSLMGCLPKEGEEKAANILAAWVASIFGFDKDTEYKNDQVSRAINDFKTYGRGLLGLPEFVCDDLSFKHQYVLFQTERVRDIHIRIDEILDDMRAYPEIVEDILVRLDYSILGRSFTENALKRIIAKLDKNIKMTVKMRDSLGEIIKKYESADVIA